MENYGCKAVIFGWVGGAGFQRESPGKPEKKQANQECPNPLPPSPGSVNNTQFAPVPLAFFFYCQLLI